MFDLSHSVKKEGYERHLSQHGKSLRTLQILILCVEHSGYVYFWKKNMCVLLEMLDATSCVNFWLLLLLLFLLINEVVSQTRKMSE